MSSTTQTAREYLRVSQDRSGRARSCMACAMSTNVPPEHGRGFAAGQRLTDDNRSDHACAAAAEVKLAWLPDGQTFPRQLEREAIAIRRGGECFHELASR